MKRIVKYTSLRGVLLALVACSKDSSSGVNQYQDDFVFYFNAKINGTPLELSAGEGEYALNTSFEFNTVDSLVRMAGHLISSDTTTQRESILIRFIANEAVASEASFNVYENIDEGKIALTEEGQYKNDPNRYWLTLNPDLVSTNYSYQWTFNDGSTSNNIYETFQVSGLETPQLEVSMVADPYNGGCSSKTTHLLNIHDDCDATIIVTPDHVLGAMTASVYPREGVVESVKWFMGETLISSNNLLPAIPLNIDGQHGLKAEITFEDGCTKEVIKYLDILGGVMNFCDVDFTATKTPLRIYAPLQRGTIEMLYFDAQGLEYTSTANVEGNFTIHNLRGFDKNENNEKTVRFQFEGKAELAAANGTTVIIEDAFGNFAVAHP